jgi:hypothetical protein
MKTLVIHPFDPTTHFLKEIYAGKDWTVIDGNVSKAILKIEIKAHDRIIMLGHGSGLGLFGFGRLFIDSNYVYLLRKKLVVCIWCNADVFATKYGLRGFNTGMIISDYEEALMYSVKESGDDINQSNSLFATAIKNAIDAPDMLQTAKYQYTSESNNVILFNSRNLYYNGTI